MVTASIVLFNPDLVKLKETIASFLNTPLKKKLFLIDNSNQRLPLDYYQENEIEYIYIGRNIGFGKGHNIVLNQMYSDFHLILNPDVVFNKSVIPKLIKQLSLESKLACITPKVKYKTNNIQYICRQFPTPLDYINRIFRFSKRRNLIHEYRDKDVNSSFYPDWVHGCFLLFKTKELKAIGGFDTRYFLYMEDVDLFKKLKINHKKVKYFPDVEIIHYHAKGSYKSLKLAYVHLLSILKYFSKWGV